MSVRTGRLCCGQLSPRPQWLDTQPISCSVTCPQWVAGSPGPRRLGALLAQLKQKVDMVSPYPLLVAPLLWARLVAHLACRLGRVQAWWGLMWVTSSEAPTWSHCPRRGHLPSLLGTFSHTNSCPRPRSFPSLWHHREGPLVHHPSMPAATGHSHEAFGPMLGGHRAPRRAWGSHTVLPSASHCPGVEGRLRHLDNVL